MCHLIEDISRIINLIENGSGPEYRLSWGHASCGALLTIPPIEAMWRYRSVCFMILDNSNVNDAHSACKAYQMRPRYHNMYFICLILINDLFK